MEDSFKPYAKDTADINDFLFKKERKHVEKTFLTPVNSEATIFFTPVEIQVFNVYSVLRGTTSCTWTIRYDTDRNATGSILASGTTSSLTLLDTPVKTKVPKNNWVWIEITVSGTPDEFHATVSYT